MPPLTTPTTLYQAAQTLAQSMAKHHTLQPRGGDSNTLYKQFQQAGYPARAISQSGVSGQSTPQAVLQSLLDSKRLQKNMLGDVTDIGVDYATAQDGMPYWCVIFGSRRP